MNESHTIKRNDRETITFTKISDTEVEVVYGDRGPTIIEGNYYPEVRAVRPIEFARTCWKQYLSIGFKAV